MILTAPKLYLATGKLEVMFAFLDSTMIKFTFATLDENSSSALDS